MNDQHRANLRNAQDMLFKAQELIKAAYGIVEDAKREEEYYMSIELRVDTMDNLTDTLDDLADSAEDAGDMIDEVL